MPRQPRLDAPGALHHVMVRGIERRAIFRDDADRADFVARLAALGGAPGLDRVRLGPPPEPRPPPGPDRARARCPGACGPSSRATPGPSTAGIKRVGHLFQNRYKSIVVEEEPYLLELVRYLHLNPLRAEVVPDLRALDRYPWTGHSALLGTVAPALAGDARPSSPSSAPPAARARARLPRLRGGGHPAGPAARPPGRAASSGASAAGPRSTALRRGREAYAGDERVLGSTEFVEQVRDRVAAEMAVARGRVPLPRLLQAVAATVGCPRRRLRAEGGRSASRRRVKGRPTSGVGAPATRGASWRRRSGCRIRRCPPPRARGERTAARWELVWQDLP